MEAIVHMLNENVGVLLFLILLVMVEIALKVRCLHRDYEAVTDAHETVKMRERAEEDGLANYDK
ncbi:MAG: hypothetical protein WDN23_14200 [Edaphobacter sp.]